MLIGVPKEITNHEYRVGLTPAGVYELSRYGHDVIVETNAGLSIGYDNEAYISAGAKVVSDVAEVYAADMIVKVKKLLSSEYQYLRNGQIVFTYLHLAVDPDLTQVLLEKDCIAIAYETVTDDLGGLPLLAPMSEVAGKLAVQAGANYLERQNGGLGILLGGVPGVKAANVVIVGGGVVGTNAACIAAGMGADVTVLDRNMSVLRRLDLQHKGRIKTVFSNQMNLEKAIRNAHLVIGAVLIRGSATPKLITHQLVQEMKDGSVIVDVSIDQGGCCETSLPTTYQNPTYTLDGVVHYCVTNMPGAVAKTSTIALTNATLPFILEVANKGWQRAAKENRHLINGINVCSGNVTSYPVARDLGYTYIDPETLI